MGPPTLIAALIVAGLVLTIAVVVGVFAAIVWLGVKLVACIAAFLGSVLAGSVVSILLLVLILAALALLYWFIFVVHRLPLFLVGLGNLTSLPAVPFRVAELPGTALMLGLRRKQTEQAMNGLSVPFTIGGRTAEAYVFMFGTASDKSYTRLSLDTAEQFSMAWTTFAGVQQDAAPLLPNLAKTLRDKEAATKQFWPMIARHGLSYNLIILENVTAARGDALKAELGAAWSDEMQALQAAGNLYVIDMTFFAKVPVSTVDGLPRFTPATLTFLRREDGDVVPFAIRVAGSNGAGTQHFVPSDPAWLYALQAAKTSITVWGIWIGHVYHWHIVTAAMVMTMFQTLGTSHIIRQLFGRQSDYLIGFDQFLLLDWSIAPPTSLGTSAQFLQMLDAFAAGRPFFADDPKATLERLGLRKEDFTKHADWDEYPVVRYLLEIWDASERYVGAVIDANYATDEQVKRDTALQAWIAASGDPEQGNVAGLLPMETKAALKAVMTSLIFRITAHGASRLNQAANPYLTYVANFPPCLQKTDIPRPDTVMDEKQLLAYLPNTGTIGSLADFLFTFTYSTPYVPFIPLDGIDADLSFTGASAHACNDALIRFRRDIEQFMGLWGKDAGMEGPPAQIHRWPLNIET
jgi:Lipoxygenase